jgi:hypothetical protein
MHSIPIIRGEVSNETMEPVAVPLQFEREIRHSKRTLLPLPSSYLPNHLLAQLLECTFH